MKIYKITNVTNLSTDSRGFFLDVGVAHGGKHISVGKSLLLEAKSPDLLPEPVQKWSAKGWVRIHEAGKEEQISGFQANQELTPSSINPIREMNGNDISEEEPILADAHEVRLTDENTGPIDQNPMNTVRITDAAAEERISTDMSPMPGETPKYLGDAEKFTIKAPRSKHQGSIVKS